MKRIKKVVKLGDKEIKVKYYPESGCYYPDGEYYNILDKIKIGGGEINVLDEIIVKGDVINPELTLIMKMLKQDVNKLREQINQIRKSQETN